MNAPRHSCGARAVLAHPSPPPFIRSRRTSILTPFLGLICQILEKYPNLNASRLYQMVRERGYAGGPDHFRHMVALYRPTRSPEAFLRLRTLPAEQGQVDWGHFGRIEQRPLMAFVMVLSWSRYIFVRFFRGQCMENFLRGHVEGFSIMDGVPRVILYDNLGSVVLERRGNAIRFNPTFLAFASHYRFEPRPVAIARGNEKGRVERAIQYIRRSFFAARSWRDLDDLNAQARAWMEQVSGNRPWPEDKKISVAEAFLQEKPQLLKLPGDPFPTEERVGVKVGKTPYVRFDGNDYSVPHNYVRKALMVTATPEEVRIFFQNKQIAAHPRCFLYNQQIEDPQHLEELTAWKRQSSKHRGMDRLYRAVPQIEVLLVRLAERGFNLGSATGSYLRLLDHYGAEDLAEAVAEAVKADTPHFASVRLILERRHHQRGLPPKLSLPLPDDPRIRDLHIQPHSLSQYDHIQPQTIDNAAPEAPEDKEDKDAKSMDNERRD